jgi:hypothetical protein
MIDLLNGLNSGITPEGANGLQGNTMSPEALAKAGGSDFSKLLEQMKKGGAQDADLLNLLSQNTKTSEQQALQSGLNENLKAMMSTDGEVLSPEAIEALNQLEQPAEGVQLPKEFAAGKTPGELRMSLPNQLAKQGDIKTNLPPEVAQNLENAKQEIAFEKGQINQIKTQVDMKSTLSKAGNQTEVDARIAPQLHGFTPKKGNKPAGTTQIHYSEDFMTQKIEQNGSGKPKVVGNRQAMNMFKEEQSVLSDTGIIKRNSQAQMNFGKMNIDSSAKQQVSASFDKVDAVAETTQNMNQSQTDLASILASKPETTTLASVTATGADVKVLDMSQVKNPEQLLSEISNYIETSRIQSGKELEVIVKHNDLGQFKINAQKGQGDMIDLQIIANSEEAQSFFTKNEANLLKTLTSQGVKVADFKLTAGESSSTSSNGNNSSDSQSSGSNQNFGRSNNGDMSNDGRQRRQQLWDQYRDRLSA